MWHGLQVQAGSICGAQLLGLHFEKGIGVLSFFRCGGSTERQSEGAINASRLTIGCLAPQASCKVAGFVKREFGIQEHQGLRCGGGLRSLRAGLVGLRPVEGFKNWEAQIASRKQVDAASAVIRFIFAGFPLVFEKCVADFFRQRGAHARATMSIAESPGD